MDSSGENLTQIESEIREVVLAFLRSNGSDFQNHEEEGAEAGQLARPKLTELPATQNKWGRFSALEEAFRGGSRTP